MTMETSVRIDMKGDLERKAARNARALERMSQRGKRHLGALSRAAARTGDMIRKLGNRYTAAGIAAAAFAATKGAINFDARFNDFAVDYLKPGQAAEVKKKLFEVALDPDIRLDPSKIMGGMEVITQMLGDAGIAIDNMRNIALTIRAAGATGGDSAALIAMFIDKFDIKGEAAVKKALSLTQLMGKEGAFEMDMFSTESKSLGASWGATGRTGMEAAKEMMALMQVIIKDVKSSAQSATAFERMLNSIYASNAAKLEASGIEVWDKELSKKAGRNIGRPVEDVVTDIGIKWGNDPATLLKIGGEEGYRAIRALTKDVAKYGYMKKVQELKALQAGESQLRDTARAKASTAKAALTQLNTRQKQGSNRVLGTIAQRTATTSDMVARGDSGGAIMYALRTWGGDNLAMMRVVTDRLSADNAALRQSISRLFTGDNAQQQKVDIGGTLKIEIDGPAKVKEARVNSDALDLEVESGVGLGG